MDSDIDMLDNLMIAAKGVIDNWDTGKDLATAVQKLSNTYDEINDAL